jgi:tRNA U38,U39,U40 pseudouridine synthase TruA
MIRILVQELFYIAGGMSIEERWKPMLCELIKKPFTQIAPAQGLYLTDITYPYFDCPPQADHLSWHDEHSWQVVT